jgi:hypothetical protein
MECNYTLYCGAVSSTNATLVCKAYPEDDAKNCTGQPAIADPPQCAFGDACGCLGDANGTISTCHSFLGGGSDCSSDLSDLLTCLKNKKCGFAPIFMPYTLDPTTALQNSLLTWFAGAAFPHLCVTEKCGNEHRAFVCCQNKGFSNTTTRGYLTPASFPSDADYCKFHKGWPNWVVPVIVLSAIVAVVLVIVLIYIIINRPDANDTYEPINK